MSGVPDRPSCALFATPIGVCGIAWTAAGAEGGVSRVLLPGERESETRQRLSGIGRLVPSPEPDADAVAADAIARIRRLLGGEPVDLAPIRLDWRGVPPFERRLYEAARGIPPGSTVTYGELALRVGEPEAARSVGRALGRNPYPIVVPCHRVVAAGGRSGGFSAHGGGSTKLRLLALERGDAWQGLPLGELSRRQ